MTRRTLAPLDRRQQWRHKRRNLVQTVLLLAGMLLLLAVCAWTLAGAAGVVLWVVIGGSVGLLLARQVSPGLVLAMYRAQEIPCRALPQVHAVLDAVVRRAELPAPPPHRPLVLNLAISLALLVLNEVEGQAAKYRSFMKAHPSIDLITKQEPLQKPVGNPSLYKFSHFGVLWFLLHAPFYIARYFFAKGHVEHRYNRCIENQRWYGRYG